MKGIRLSSYGIFGLSLLLLLIAKAFRIKVAADLFEPFALINLAHYSWYQLERNRNLANGLGIMHLAHWSGLVFLLVTSSFDFWKYTGMIVISFSFFWIVGFQNRPRKKIGSSVILLVLGYIMFAPFQLNIIAFGLACASIATAAQVPISYWGKFYIGIGTFLVTLSITIRCIANFSENIYDSSLLVLGYFIGHWLILYGGKQDEAITADETHNGLPNVISHTHFRM